MVRICACKTCAAVHLLKSSGWSERCRSIMLTEVGFEALLGWCWPLQVSGILQNLLPNKSEYRVQQVLDLPEACSGFLPG